MIPVAYNVGSLKARQTSTLVTAIGIGLVIFTLASSMMLSEGVRRTMGMSGRPDRAIVLRKGSDAELSSTIESAQVGLIRAAPGVKRSASGNGVGGGEGVIVIIMNKPGTEMVSNVRVRGVPDNVRDYRTEFTIAEGRPAKPGTDEVVIGRQLVDRFTGLRMGGSFELKKNRKVTVVGIFEADGSSFESEIWVDIDTLNSSFGRKGSVSSVRVQLDSSAKYDGFAAAVEQNKQLGLEAFREDDYYRKQSEGTAEFVGGMGTVISFFFAMGAIIGAMITMNAMVSGRRREIGIMRALGFSRTSVLAAIMLEAVMVAGLGAVLGSIASLGMGLVSFSMMNLNGWNEVVFKFTPSAPILVSSIVVGVTMGLAGGFIPAWRASRTLPGTAMRM